MQKGVLRNFIKFTGKHLCQILFLMKLQASGLQHYQKETLAQVFSCDIYEICKNTFFHRTPLAAPSAYNLLTQELCARIT